jgi:hypothetical protein
MDELPTDDAPPDVIEVRRNPDGSLDEIVAHGALVHLEQMDNCAWFLAVERDGHETKVWFRSPRKIATYVEVDGREVSVVQPGARQQGEWADG